MILDLDHTINYASMDYHRKMMLSVNNKMFNNDYLQLQQNMDLTFPFYSFSDALDNANNKQAIKLADNILKKQKDFSCAKVYYFHYFFFKMLLEESYFLVTLKDYLKSLFDIWKDGVSFFSQFYGEVCLFSYT